MRKKPAPKKPAPKKPAPKKPAPKKPAPKKPAPKTPAPKKPAPKKPAPKKPEVVPLAQGLEHLSTLLPERAMEFLRHNTRYEPPTATLLLTSTFGRYAAAATASVVVVEGDVEAQDLILTTRHLFGVQGQRNQHIVVFTGSVACDVVSTVPEDLVLFCGGLTARRLACFDGGDSDTRVFRRLDAPVIISGLGSGCASLEGEVTVRAKQICGFIATSKANKGAVKASGAKMIKDLAKLWPQVADALDDQEPWELVQEHVDAGTLPF